MYSLQPENSVLGGVPSEGTPERTFALPRKCSAEGGHSSVTKQAVVSPFSRALFAPEGVAAKCAPGGWVARPSGEPYTCLRLTVSQVAGFQFYPEQLNLKRVPEGVWCDAFRRSGPSGWLRPPRRLTPKVDNGQFKRSTYQ